MFVAIGILSILAGLFVFKQGTALTILSGLAQSKAATTVSGAFLLVAICMVIAGVFSCCSKNGERRGMIITAAIMYLLASLFGFAYRTGDMKVWSIVCLILGIIYIFAKKSNKTETPATPRYTPSDTNNTYGQDNTQASVQSAPQTVYTAEKDPRWKETDKGFVACPECGKRVSVDFISIRGFCPDCKYPYYLEKKTVEEPIQEKQENKQLIRDAKWTIVDKNFTICPGCGKRMSLDFIKARGKCPECNCVFYNVTSTEAEFSQEEKANAEGQKLIWTRDSEGFTKCPKCEAYMSFDYILAKGQCPKCGQKFA